jgi:hypothetical protein
MATKWKRNNWQIIFGCELCGENIERGQFFCGYCGPPDSIPKPLPKGITFTQVLLRISLLTLIFFSFTFYKLNKDYVDKTNKIIPLEKVELISHDTDLKTIHAVGVQNANVRNKPGGKIVMVLYEGERIEIVREEGGWIEINAHNKTGWIFAALVTTSFE